MCGITGIYLSRANIEWLGKTIRPMRDALTHRGPDDSGDWIDRRTGRVAFGHRRLSILDLSTHGHQPMKSADERYIIVFNGEIYNFQTLRRTLESKGHKFHGHSDTEVALAAITEWGFETALPRFEGMFAIGLWDQKEECLFLARDRFGEKPLYYGQNRGVFLFGSELKSLESNPCFNAEIDRDALTILL